MADKQREFEHESLQDRNAIARYLEAITEGFRNGSLSLSSQDGEILLEPAGLIDLSIKATQAKGRMELTLQAKWKPRDAGDGAGDTLSISANGE